MSVMGLNLNRNRLVEPLKPAGHKYGPKDIEVDLDYAVKRVCEILPEEYKMVMALERGSLTVSIEEGDRRIVPEQNNISFDKPSVVVMRLLNQAIVKYSAERDAERLAARREKEAIMRKSVALTRSKKNGKG